MTNKKSKNLFLGWISFGMGTLIILGSFAHPYDYHRDYAIENLLTTGQFVWICASVAFLIGTNIFIVLAFLAGSRAWKKTGSLSGKTLSILSLVLFFIGSSRQFLPTGEIKSQSHLSEAPTSKTVSIEENVFRVHFDRPKKQRIAFVEGYEGVIFESTDERFPFLRVEFSKKIDEEFYKKNFGDILKNYATLANIKTPEITIGESNIGKKGTYQGVVEIQGKPVRVLGHVYIGGESMVGLMVFEPLADSLSDDAIKFLLSVSRKH